MADSVDGLGSGQRLLHDGGDSGVERECQRRSVSVFAHLGPGLLHDVDDLGHGVLAFAFSKLVLVVMYYMHLKFDTRIYAIIFTVPVFFALLILGGLLM